jgi:hypothetical protein
MMEQGPLGGIHISLKRQKNQEEGAGKVAHVIKHLPTKCEALSSNPTTAKKSIKNQVEDNGGEAKERPLLGPIILRPPVRWHLKC